MADALDGTMGLAVLVPSVGESFRINAGEQLTLDARELSELLVIFLPLVLPGYETAARQENRTTAASMA